MTPPRAERLCMPWFLLMTALLLAACSSIAGTAAPSTSNPPTRSSAPPTLDPRAEILELHYLRSTIAGRQAEHTAVVRGDGRVALTDELAGTEHRFALTPKELARLDELLATLVDAPEPTSVVSDVGRIDARFPVDGRDVSVSVDDWSMAGGTARLPAGERAVADAMIELRDLLVRMPNGSTSGSAPSTAVSTTG